MKQLFFLFLYFSAYTLLPAQNLYDLNHIPEIKITFEQKNWSLILDSLKRDGKKKRLTATITIDGEIFEKVGVRYKGNSSYFNVEKYGSSKLPFNIKASHKKGKQRFPGGIETLKLSNIFRDPSFLREVLSYDIARKYMPVPRCNFAKLYVNDTYLGLYNNTESIDEKFLLTHFGTDTSVLIKCDPEWGIDLMEGCPEGDKSSLMYQGDDPGCYVASYEMKAQDGVGWDELIHLTNVLNNEPEKIEEVLNVDATLWMHAFNNVLVNLDSYTGRLSHNYYMYKTPDGLFTPLLWDMNLSLGGFQFDGISPRMLTEEDMQTMSPFVHYKTRNPKRPLIVNLLANSLYRKIYIGHLRTILNENFSNDYYIEKADSIRQIIDNEVLNDENKLYGYDDFKKNLNKTATAGKSKIIGITQLMKPRIEYLSAHPLLAKAPPQISNVHHLKFGSSLAVQGTVEAADKVWLFFRTSETQPFQMVEMFDDGSNNDEGSEDEIWGTTIDYQVGTHYYIVAEGSRSAMCSPENAAWEFYEVEADANH